MRPVMYHNLEVAIKKSHLRKGDIAILLRISPSEISRLLRGEYAINRFAGWQLEKLEQALGHSVAYLFKK